MTQRTFRNIVFSPYSSKKYTIRMLWNTKLAEKKDKIVKQSYGSPYIIYFTASSHKNFLRLIAGHRKNRGSFEDDIYDPRRASKDYPGKNGDEKDRRDVKGIPTGNIQMLYWLLHTQRYRVCVIKGNICFWSAFFECGRNAMFHLLKSNICLLAFFY